MINENISFGGYEDEQKAVRIFVEYLPDIERLGLELRAIDLVNRCSRSLDLDLKLDELISEFPEPGFHHHLLSDVSTNGSWENAVRAYEEQ
jgi:hypothetical protein